MCRPPAKQVPFVRRTLAPGHQLQSIQENSWHFSSGLLQCWHTEYIWQCIPSIYNCFIYLFLSYSHWVEELNSRPILFLNHAPCSQLWHTHTTENIWKRILSGWTSRLSRVREYHNLAQLNRFKYVLYVWIQNKKQQYPVFFYYYFWAQSKINLSNRLWTRPSPTSPKSPPEFILCFIKKKNCSAVLCCPVSLICVCYCRWPFKIQL